MVWPCTQKSRTSSLMSYYHIFTLSSLMSLESKYEGQQSTENHGKIIQLNNRQETEKESQYEHRYKMGTLHTLTYTKPI